MSLHSVVTIVSGLPRSGTSMMMKMLEAGGMSVVQDGIRQANVDNPGGYYELEQVKQIKQDPSFLKAAAGKAVKVLFNFLYQLPAEHSYRIIFMRRNMDEILDSQQKMLERRGEANDIPDKEIARIYDSEIRRANDWAMAQPNMEVMFVHYTDILNDPRVEAARVNAFCGDILDVERMAAVVDERLYRNRSV